MNQLNASQIETYIDTVSRQKEAIEPLSMADSEAMCRKIALELGLTPEDLNAADKVAHEHLTRGKRYLNEQLYAHAQTDLMQAFGFRPHDTDVARLLAEAHMGLWSESGDATHLDKADDLASFCLLVDPSFDAGFEIRRRVSQGYAQKKRAQRQRLWGLLGLLTVGAVVMFNAVGPSFGPSPSEVPPAVETPASKPAAQSGGVSMDDLPIQWSAGFLDSAAVQITISRFFHYEKDGSWATSYTLYGWLENQGADLIKDVEVKVTVLTADGHIWLQETHEIYPTYKAPLRPSPRQVQLLLVA